MPDNKFDTDKSVSAYVINLVASVINGTVPPENDANLDWGKIIDFAKKQCVLNIIAYSCEKLTNKPDPTTLKYLKEFRMQKIVVEAQQEIEACDAMDKLEKMGVRHMPLKGYIVKNLYPSPDMRTMGDLDLLVEPDRCDEVVKAFEADGFSFCGEGNLHSNVERGNAYIEFHRSMVDEEHETLNGYFGNGFERATPADGYSYRYELSREDLYIFLIAHVAKHYRYGGTGIRTLLDLYIYRKAYTDLDLDYIHGELQKIGLDVFQEKIESIADEWYGGEFNGEFNSVSAYIISGGVYGTMNEAFLNEFINANDEALETEKTKNFIRAIFPDKEIMSIRYPILKKCIFLLPVFWVIRFFETLIRYPVRFKNRAKHSVKILQIDNDLVNAQRDSGIEKL